MISCVAAGLFSCSETDGAANGSGGTGGTSTGTVVSCQNDPRVDAIGSGTHRRGTNGALDFELVMSDPSPPIKGDNRLVVRVTDPDGGAVRGSLEVTLVMPDHGHPASSLPKPELDETTGAYALDPVTLFMAGVWQLGLQMTPESGEPGDQVSFWFCVEG